MNGFSKILFSAATFLSLAVSQSAFSQHTVYAHPVRVVAAQPVAQPPIASHADNWYRYKLYTGINFSKIGFRDEKGIVDPVPKIRPAFDLGLRIDHYYDRSFSFYKSVGFRYSYGSYRVEFDNGEVKATQHRFVVPFTVGLLGEVGDCYVGFGPNVHIGASVGGTCDIDYDGLSDSYSCGSDESSFVCGLGLELWLEYKFMFYSVSYNKSLEWYDMPVEFGDFTSRNRGMVSLNVGFCF